LASKTPAQPANNRSTFNVHISFGNYKLDLVQGQNADFDKLVTANLAQDAPSSSSTAPTPTTTICSRSTTISPTFSSSATPQPIQTGVLSLRAGVSTLAFPVGTAKRGKATKDAGGLTQPRGLIFDASGNLLVVQNGLGISAHKISTDGCFTSSKVLITQRNLNHSIVLSQDGTTLFASSATSVYSWGYDATTRTVSGTSKTVISGIDNKGHVTRTRVIPPKQSNLLIVSHGSNDNFDYGSVEMKTGRSCVKVFDTMKVPTDGYDCGTGGYQMGYGLRNEVGAS
jgi:glucose/arabinose dehydrogenase